MMQTVQLAIADAVYATALREALTRSGPWHVVSAASPDPNQQCVLVIDEDALNRLPLPMPNPQRVVLIAHKDPQQLSRAWDAGIVSVVSADDPPDTVLLAIMAAALRARKCPVSHPAGGLSPTPRTAAAPIGSETAVHGSKRHKVN